MRTAKVYITSTEGMENKEEVLGKALELIPQWRRDYVSRKTTADKLNSVFVYLLLQKLTKEEYGATDIAPFTYGEAEKPYFSQIGLFFSLSHCKTAAGAAVSDTEIGFDIMDNRRINEKAALRICSPDEWEQYKAADDKQFFLRQLWCKKESIVKQKGTGFTQGFDTVDTEKAEFLTAQSENYFCALYFGGDFSEKSHAEFKEIPWKQLI